MDTGFVISDIVTISKTLGFIPNELRPMGWVWYVDGNECRILAKSGNRHPYHAPDWIIEGLFGDTEGVTIIPTKPRAKPLT